MLTGLRKELGEDRAELLRIDHDGVELDPEMITVAEPNGEEFLAGFYLNDPAFEDWLRDERQAADVATDVTWHAPGPAGPEKPSIAVLPFVNLSGDPEQEYFSDGVTEDIITELTRFHSLFVIARNSSFAFRGHDVDPQDAGQKLGVQFVVQGSVRRAGNRLRISAQLVDTVTAGHLWSDRFDRDMTDVFALQDEIAATVATMVSGHVDIANMRKSERKHPKDLNAYDVMCRAEWLGLSDYSTPELGDMFEKVIELDPAYALAYARLAAHYAYRIFVDAVDGRDVVEKVKVLGGTAVQLAPGDALVHAPLAEACALLGEHELAAHHLNKTLSINPNAFQSMAHSAEAMALLGDHDKALTMIRAAMERDPYSSTSFRENMFDICYMAGEYEMALAQLVGWTDYPFHIGVMKAAALAMLDRIPEAQQVLRNVEARRPENWDARIVAGNLARMCAKPEDGGRWLEGCRKAGLEV